MKVEGKKFRPELQGWLRGLPPTQPLGPVEPQPQGVVVEPLPTEQTKPIEPELQGWLRGPPPTQNVTLPEFDLQSKRFVQQPKPTPEIDISSVPDRLPDRDPVERSFQSTKGIDQDTAVRALEISKQSGIPAWELIQNPELFDLAPDREPVNLQNLKYSSPALARMLADPSIMAVARDDLKGLSKLERLFHLAGAGFKTRELQYEIDQRMKFGGKSKENLQRIAELKAQIGRESRTKGPLEWMTYNASAILPDMIRSTIRGGEYGLVAGSLAAVAGQAGPQVAVPEEIITVPVAASAGYLSGVALESWKAESAGIYRELVETGISPQLAQPLSDLGGMISAGLETVGFGGLFKIIPGTRFITRRIAKNVITSTPVKNFFKKLVFGTLESATVETSTELLQEVNNVITTIAGIELSNAIDDTKIPLPKKEELVQRFLETGKRAFWGSLPYAGLGSAGHMAMTYEGGPQRSTRGGGLTAEARREQTIQFIEKVAEAADNISLTEKSPETFEEFVKGYEVEYDLPSRAYVPAETMERLYQQALEGELDIDGAREEDLEALGVDRQEYYEALSSGGLVGIPTEKVWSLARKPGWEELRQEISFDPTPDLVDSYEDVEASLNRMDQEIRSYPMERVERIRQDFVAAGIDPQSAKLTASLIGRHAQVVGKVSNMTAEEYIEWRGYLIQRGEEGITVSEEALNQATIQYHGPIADWVQETLSDPNTKFRYHLGQASQSINDGISTEIGKPVDGVDVVLMPDMVRHVYKIRPTETNEQLWSLLEDNIQHAKLISRAKEKPSQIHEGKPFIFTVDAGKEGLGFIGEYSEGKKGKRLYITTVVGGSIERRNRWVKSKLSKLRQGETEARQDPAATPGYPSLESIQDASRQGLEYNDDIERESRQGEEPLYQHEGISFAPVRGAVQFTEDGKALIEIFKAANPSTAIHEAAHVFRRDLQALYQNPKSPGWIYRDWITACEFVGVDRDAEIWTREQEEQFARAFEAYLMEGQAPVPTLKLIFNHFREWLTSIYQTVKTLGVEVTPEIRSVFDRLLVEQTEIERAEQWLEIDRSTWGPDMPESFKASNEAYVRLETRARNSMSEAIHAKYTKELRRLQVVWRLQGKEKADAEPTHVVMDEALHRGGLNQDALLARYDAETVAALRQKRPGLVKKTGPVLWEELAADLFRDPDELLNDLVNVKTKKQIVEDYAREAQSTWEASWQPHEEVLTDEYEDLVGEEYNMLVEETGGVPDRAYLAAKKPQVRESIARKVGDLPAEDLIRKTDELRNELLEAKKAARTAYREGRKDEALMHKERELDRLLRYREVVNRRRKLEKAERYLKRVIRSQVQGPHSPAGLPWRHLQIIRLVLDGYGLVPQSMRPSPDTPSLAQFLEELRNTEGHELAIPNSVLDGPRGKRLRARRNDLKLTANEVDELVSAVRQIERNGRNWKKLIARQTQQSIDQAIDEMVRRSTQQPAKPVTDIKDALKRKTTLQNLQDFLDGARASLVKPETFLDMLDGFEEFGPFYNYIFEPIKMAEDFELTRGAEILGQIQAAFNRIPVEQRRTWHKKYYTIPGVPTELSRSQMVSVALNVGNDGNYRAVSRGYGHLGWSQETVDTVTNQLTQEEWQLVQDIWRILDKIFPLLNEKHELMYGVPLPKVEPRMVKTPYGEIDGGYYPLIWDIEQSLRAEGIKKGEDQFNLFRGGFKPVSTKAHAEHTRVGGTLPPLLDLSVIAKHIKDTLHFATHGPALRDAHKLITQPRVQNAMISVIGKNAYDQMMPWLQEIAVPQNISTSWLDKSAGFLRRNATVVMLGLKVTVAAKQFPSFFQTINMVGTKHSIHALVDFLKSMRISPIEAWQKAEWVNSLSPSMAQRRNKWDRELQAQTNTVKGWLGNWTQPWRDIMFWMIGQVDGLATYPTWMAGYSKGMEMFQGNEQKAVEYADLVVRRTQPTAAIKDLAGIQRGGELQKTLVMFYTFFNQFYNRMYQTNAAFRARKISKGELFKAYWWILVAPAIMSQGITDVLKGDIPDEGDEWIKKYGKAIISYYIAGYPVARDLINAILTGYDYSPTPAAEGLEAVIRLSQEGMQLDAEGMAMRGIEVAGYATGMVPSSQAVTTIQGALDLVRGETQNPLSLLVKRKKK